MDFQLTLLGKDQWLRKIQRVVDTLGPRLLETMRNEMVRLADYVRANKLSGQVLNRRSGDLSRSITGQAEATGYHIQGKVGSYGVPYAPVHEFGMTFSRAVSVVFGRPIIPIEVTFHYPMRAFVRPSFTENQSHIEEALRATALEVLRAT